MSAVAQIKKTKPVIHTIQPPQGLEPEPLPYQDFATRERKAFIESVSPFRYDHERVAYLGSLVRALIFGSPMPHERIGA